MTERTSDHVDPAVELAWASWSELGVGGWRRGATVGCIDLEPLLALSARLAEREARLAAAVATWRGQHGRLVSGSRLRRWIGRLDAARSWDRLEPELAQASRVREKPADAARLDLVGNPALLGLRLRSALGLGAAAEVLRTLLLATPGEELDARSIALEASYTRRNVADALEGLVAAGVVAARRPARTALYKLAQRAPIERIFGPLPERRSSHAALCFVAWRLGSGLNLLQDAPSGVRSVEARRLAEDLRDEAGRAGLELPHLPPESAYKVLASWWRTAVSL